MMIASMGWIGWFAAKHKPSRASLLGMLGLATMLMAGIGYGVYSLNGLPNATDWPLEAAHTKAFHKAINNPNLSLEERQNLLETMLTQSPNNPDLWQTLSRIYMDQRQIEKAVTAIATATRYAPENADMIGEYALLLTLVNDGILAENTRALFNKAIALADDPSKYQFYFAEMEWRNGNPQQAIKLWQEVANHQTTSNTEWGSIAKQRLANLNGGTAAPAMPQFNEEQQAMIMGMVESLQQRLAENPDDEEGWLRLIRSFEVLGDVPQERLSIKSLLAYYERTPSLTPQQQNQQAAMEERLNQLTTEKLREGEEDDEQASGSNND